MTPFLDSAKVLVEAGKGGDSCYSFQKDKSARYPRPDGGSGGAGGNIIIKADENVHTLLDIQYKKHYRAKPGGRGGPNNRTGEIGGDYVMPVPVGTEIRDKSGNLIAD